MAVVVSHAMRRFPKSSPPDSINGLTSEEKNKDWKLLNTSLEGGSALSRSMRYADPWLYNSLNIGGQIGNELIFTPALIICSCPDYLNGTKRSTKKSPTTCKKCKGTRLALGDATKFDTVRCYPTSSNIIRNTPMRAGTMHISSSSKRPSILPSTDPYDLMRRSRLSSPEGSNVFNPNSTLPSTIIKSSSPKYSNNFKSVITNKIMHNQPPPPPSSSRGRRSILECNINPYELMDFDHSKSTSIKKHDYNMAENQRSVSRSRVVAVINEEDPSSPLSSSRHSTSSSSLPSSQVKSKHNNNDRIESDSANSSSSNSTPTNHHNRFKSILKKRSTTFSDDEMYSSNCGNNTVDQVISSSDQQYSRSSCFYLPMPTVTRKKVQFLVQHDSSNVIQDESVAETFGEDKAIETAFKEKVEEKKLEKICKLQRSVSERVFTSCKAPSPVFYDTMALRGRSSKSDIRSIFGEEDLKRLDGLCRKEKNTNIEMPRSAIPNNKVVTDAKIINDEETPKIENVDKKLLKNQTDFKTISQMPKTDSSSIIINTTTPPLAPPRKRLSNRSISLQPPVIHSQSTTVPLLMQTNNNCNNNKTVVQITSETPAILPTSAVHKIQIKNELFSDNTNNIQNVNVLDSPRRKTSIMITGDDCYCTINVNDDIPLYQSSVVVNDSTNSPNSSTYITPTPEIVVNRKSSSTIYITGNFEKISEEIDSTLETNNNGKECCEHLSKLLNNPVEAVRRNLVPHVCGKDNHQQQLTKKDDSENLESSVLKDYETDDMASDLSSLTQYELMDANSSECYTDNSNRSSITEEDLGNRTKFYELLAESALIEVSEDQHHYESIKKNEDPIYEEISIPPPLPTNPPPIVLLDDIQLDKEYTTRSIFEGASKYDILSYLVDAKERGIVPEDSYTFSNISISSSTKANSTQNVEEETKESYSISNSNTVSDSNGENSLALVEDDLKQTFQKTSAEVERNDSGVGSETSKCSLSKYRIKEASTLCEDCETTVDFINETDPLICRKCLKKRSERKEIIAEIVETEEKYSRDLQIILEEFYQPMLVAGLLTPEQLSSIFLNVEELLENSQSLAEKLRDTIEITVEQGDEDLLTVNIGKVFLEAAPMLHGFEAYCVRQGSASLLLSSLEKEKELLRIFLRVSQMENTMLRRMNLNSFLMVPVQRVTKYPLLLARLYKVTPNHYETIKEQLREAQHKIELHLNHMNSETKDVPSKLWRRISNQNNSCSSSGALGISGIRRSSTEMDLVNIKLRKIAVDVLEWNHDEAKFALEGKLLFTQPTDNNWRKGRTIKLTPVNALLVINGKPSGGRIERSEENGLIFSHHSSAREAALLLVRDKNGRYSLLREPLYLDRCVIAADPAWQSYFEVQELIGKETFIFKAEDAEQTKTWYTQIQFHAQGMGAWRKRRNALANIMINGMGLRS